VLALKKSLEGAGTAGWNADTAAGPLGAGTLTLVEGSSFCISAANGDLQPEQPHGVFFEDTRILSRWLLTVDGEPLEPLTAKTKEPYRALIIGRVRRSDGYTDSPLIVERLRELGTGISEQVTVRNYSAAPADCTVSLHAEVDFADLFEVKEARIHRHWEKPREATGGSLTIRAFCQDVRKGIAVSAPGADITPEAISYRVNVPPHGYWTTVLTVMPIIEAAGSPMVFVHPDGEAVSPRTGGGRNGSPRFRPYT
jgi:hypothetical protein